MSDNLPNTILYPEQFKKSKPAGYDGVFDWSWTDGCFGKTKITPMDWDGVVERKGNFIVFETKNPGQQIPDGQKFTLQAAHKTGLFTIMIIWGKRIPESFEVWYPKGEVRKYSGIEKAKKIVSRWFEYANKNPR